MEKRNLAAKRKERNVTPNDQKALVLLVIARKANIRARAQEKPVFLQVNLQKHHHN